MAAIRTICSYVSRRSAAMVAAAVYGLWALRDEAEASLPAQAPAPNSMLDPVSHLPSPPSSSPVLGSLGAKSPSENKTVVAYNGSVIERYPSYLQICQDFLDSLVDEEVSDSSTSSVKGMDGLISLVEAKESSLLGAAVALAAA